MPRPRFFKLEMDRRREILEVAAEHFAASGYEGASLNQIIADIGISKGAFYYIFDDKEDLFLAVVDHAGRLFLPDLAHAEELEAESFWPSLREWMQRAHETVRENPWLVGVARLVYDPPPGTRAAAVVAEQFAEARSWQASLITKGQALGVVRDDLPAELLLALLVGADEAADRWMVEHWNEFDDDECERISTEVFEVFRRMLAPRNSCQEVKS